MTSFSIGTQNAASINNVGGNMVIQGGLHASADWSYELRAEVAHALDELARLPLPATVRASVGDALCAAAQAANGSPDKQRAADMLAKAARTLTDARVLTGEGTGLLESLARAARALGPIGASVLALL
jgi:hypothetical protein